MVAGLPNVKLQVCRLLWAHAGMDGFVRDPPDNDEPEDPDVVFRGECG